jgi:UDP-glucuronate 4-epimerase
VSRERRFLVTGAHGCIGAWVVHELLALEEAVVTFDLSADPRRLALLLDERRLSEVPHIVGDICDLEALELALDEREITHVIHLAALQVPFCLADPPLGARVNVLGTVNVLEAARHRLSRIAPVVYASSVAAFDPPEDAEPPTMSSHPGTLYGVFKRTDESIAWRYYHDYGVPSVGLRPHIIYGVGRDQGLTSTATTAMLAAAAGASYTIPYGGACQFQLAADVARGFIAASLSGGSSVAVHNLPGRRIEMAEVVEAITAAAPDSSIDFERVVLPFPEEVDSRSFTSAVPDFVTTPLGAGVRSTIERFRALLEEGRLSFPIREVEATR